MASISFQALKKAEDEASALVEAARKERAEKMKMAKIEAKKEIDQFKAQQMERLNQLKAESEKQGDEVAAMMTKTDQTIEQLKKDLAANEAKGVELLMNAVISVETKIPVARKGMRMK